MSNMFTDSDESAERSIRILPSTFGSFLVEFRLLYREYIGNAFQGILPPLSPADNSKNDEEDPDGEQMAQAIEEEITNYKVFVPKENEGLKEIERGLAINRQMAVLKRYLRLWMGVRMHGMILAGDGRVYYLKRQDPKTPESLECKDSTLATLSASADCTSATP